MQAQLLAAGVAIVRLARDLGSRPQFQEMLLGIFGDEWITFSEMEEEKQH